MLGRQSISVIQLCGLVWPLQVTIICNTFSLKYDEKDSIYTPYSEAIQSVEYSGNRINNYIPDYQKCHYDI